MYGTVSTPYPHFTAPLLHEQHLQNKFGIQIAKGNETTQNTVIISLKYSSEKTDLFWINGIGYSAGSTLHFMFHSIHFLKMYSTVIAKTPQQIGLDHTCLKFESYSKDFQKVFVL